MDQRVPDRVGPELRRPRLRHPGGADGPHPGGVQKAKGGARRDPLRPLPRRPQEARPAGARRPPAASGHCPGRGGERLRTAPPDRALRARLGGLGLALLARARGDDRGRGHPGRARPGGRGGPRALRRLAARRSLPRPKKRHHGEAHARLVRRGPAGEPLPQGPPRVQRRIHRAPHLHREPRLPVPQDQGDRGKPRGPGPRGGDRARARKAVPLRGPRRARPPFLRARRPDERARRGLGLPRPQPRLLQGNLHPGGDGGPHLRPRRTPPRPRAAPRLRQGAEALPGLPQ